MSEEDDSNIAQIVSKFEQLGVARDNILIRRYRRPPDANTPIDTTSFKSSAANTKTTTAPYAPQVTLPDRIPSNERENIRCDGCTQKCLNIWHRCQDCPDFDYCSSCVVNASHIHPYHRFIAEDANGASYPQLIDECTAKMRSYSDSLHILRLKDCKGETADVQCESCTTVTDCLSAVHSPPDDPENLTGNKAAEIVARWPIRISKLVSAMQRGCLFCTFVLDKFFGHHIQTMKLTSLGPSQPWYLEEAQSFFQKPHRERDDLLSHVMKLLTTLESDEFDFFITAKVTKDLGASPDFDTLEIGALRNGLETRTAAEIRRIFCMRGLFSLTLKVYAKHGTPPAAFLRSRPPNASPGSCSSIQQARSWLQECRNHHVPECASKDLDSKDFPKRLLDVSIDGIVKLWETDASCPPYAALSYCWGGPQPYCLTKSTYLEKTQGIKVQELSKTLQDSVLVTRGLNLKYLWVDSMCIVQDDDIGKQDDIAQMLYIYSHADVTIAAGIAGKADDGFLDDRSDTETGLWKNLIPLRYRIPNAEVKTQKDATTTIPETTSVIWLLHEPNVMSQTFLPLDIRGWCLQERLLSPRYLKYGRWPTWRCNKCVKSDGGWYPVNEGLEPHELFFRSNLLKEHPLSTQEIDTIDVDKIIETWEALVFDYTKRELSSEDDRLQAIDGIAKAIHSTTKMKYVFGIWVTNMLHGLMWYTQHREWLIRPKTQTAPTWSWASVICPVLYGQIAKDATVLAQVLSCTVQSPVRNTIVELQGPMREISISDVLRLFTEQDILPTPYNDGLDDPRGLLPLMMHDLARLEGASTYTATPRRAAFTPEDIVQTLAQPIYAMATFSQGFDICFGRRRDGYCVSGLLLQKTGVHYERIGAFVNERQPWLDGRSGWQMETVLIR